MDTNIHPLDVLEDPIQREYFELAVKKIFSSTFFSICDAQSAIRIINPKGEAIIRELQPLHCVNWSEISPAMATHVLDVFVKAMVFSPILLSSGNLDSSVSEAKTILMDMLQPRRRRVNYEEVFSNRARYRQEEEIVVEEGDVRVVISGDQQIKEFSVQGITSPQAVATLNKAIKESQKVAARKLQEMGGGLGGMLGGGGQ